MENWKPLTGIKEIEGLYLISDLGRVNRIAITRGNQKSFLKPRVNKTGYVYVQFWYNNKNHPYRLHRLVAKHFCSNPNNYDEVNHIDGDKTNNSATNLEWTNRSLNNKHAFAIGLKHPSVFTEDQKKQISLHVSESMKKKWAERKGAIDFN